MRNAMNDLEMLVTEYIENNKNRLFNLLSTLIQVNTGNYNTYGNEALIAPLIFQEYQKLGLKAEIYYPTEVPGILDNSDFLPNRGTEKRPNISGVYTAPGSLRTIMLAAHTDVMPAGNRDLWSIDPFGGVIKDGRVYGRGANDDKFGIASAIMAFDAIRFCGLELMSNVILEAYCDEEYGGGNGALAASLRYHPDAIINMDGGNYEIWSCSMGGQVLKIDVRALKPQDSSTLVVDALLVIREELKTFINNRHAELEEDRYFAHTDMSRSAVRFYEFSAGKGDLGCNLDSGTMSFVFYTNRSREQIAEELSSAKERICACLERMDVQTAGFEPLSRFFYCLSLPDTDVTLQLVKQAAEDAAGRPVRITGSCLTDLSLFLKYGSEHSLNFGLVRDFGLYGGAHQTDEFVDQQALVEYCKAIALLLIRWCGVQKTTN